MALNKDTKQPISNKTGWLAHLARHAPSNECKGEIPIGSSPTGSIIRNCYPKLLVKMR